MKSIILIIVCSIAITNGYSIVYRHDVGEIPYRKLALESQFNCVGEVFNDYKPSGSCVLIGERYVLTAAHLFIESDMFTDTSYMYHGKMISMKEALKKSTSERDSMKQVILYHNRNNRVGKVENYQFRFQRRMYDAKRIVIFPGYLDSATKGSYDICLVELEEPVTNVVPSIVNTRLDELGDTIVNVGFGASGDASIPEDVGLYYQRLAGQNMVDSIGGRLYKGQATQLVYDFDHPAMKEYNICGGNVPLPLEDIASGGDSGGGMFRKTKRGWELVGVCSGTNHDFNLLLKIGYYGQSGSYTRVSVFKDWLGEEMR